MATLTLKINGELSDLDFLRVRFEGAIDDVVDDWADNLDDPENVVVEDWEIFEPAD